MPTITAGSLATGDTTTTFTQVFSSRNAGTDALLPVGIVNDGNGGDNYSYTFVTAAGTINQLAITVSAATDAKTYDGTTSFRGTCQSSLQVWVPVMRANFTQAFDSRNAGPRTLIASRHRQRRQRRQQLLLHLHDRRGNHQSARHHRLRGERYQDLRRHHNLNRRAHRRTQVWASAIQPISRQAFDSRDAGPRTLIASGIVNDGNGGDNYSYTFMTAAGTINQLAITVSAATDTKTYDGTTASTGVPLITAGSLATGDTTTNFTQAFDSRNAGPESLVPIGIVNDGNGGDNYSYTFVTCRRDHQPARDHRHRGERHQDLRWHNGLRGRTDHHRRQPGDRRLNHQLHAGLRQPRCRPANLDSQRHRQ